jgi:hypothetical protein
MLLHLPLVTANSRTRRSRRADDDEMMAPRHFYSPLLWIDIAGNCSTGLHRDAAVEADLHQTSRRYQDSFNLSHCFRSCLVKSHTRPDPWVGGDWMRWDWIGWNRWDWMKWDGWPTWHGRGFDSRQHHHVFLFFLSLLLFLIFSSFHLFILSSFIRSYFYISYSHISKVQHAWAACILSGWSFREQNEYESGQTIFKGISVEMLGGDLIELHCIGLDLMRRDWIGWVAWSLIRFTSTQLCFLFFLFSYSLIRLFSYSLICLFSYFLTFLFCYFVILLFCYFVILLFCYFVILLFCYFVILSFSYFLIFLFSHFLIFLFSYFLIFLFSYFVILLFCYFVILLFCYFVILLFCYFLIFMGSDFLTYFLSYFHIFIFSSFHLSSFRFQLFIFHPIIFLYFYISYSHICIFTYLHISKM